MDVYMAGDCTHTTHHPTHPVQLILVDMENVCLCGYVELVGSCVRARVCVRVGVCVYVIVTLNS